MKTLPKYIIEEWSLEKLRPFSETHSSFLFEAVYQYQPVIVKYFKDGSDEANSVFALKHYNSSGAITVLQSSANAVMLPKIMPAITLDSCVQNDVKVFCTLVEKLYQQPLNDAIIAKLPNISALGRTFNIHAQQRSSNRSQGLSAHIVQKASSIFAALCASQTRQVVVHGDLHHFNILYDAAHGWVAIDPKGYIGEPEVEVSPFLRNPLGSPGLYCTEHTIKSRIEAIADCLQLDQERILLWFYCLSVLSVLYQEEKNLKCTEWSKLVYLLDTMIRKSGD